ncbi:hypothetical protein EKN06_00560 [Croceicoccus ponticola]|uniref:Uncharacterized protein n=1 Tax=Croceicoccus ponticola TaxID=2217664 RepID=A0A437GZG8_9SPHN|nr:hypothetical protein EKN06_00560 [Croceicoccus ponticola]
MLQRVEGGEITVYRATQLAGFRQKKPPSPAGKLSYHWKRASHDERQRFVAAHAKDINRVLREIRDLLLEAKKPAE